MRLYKKQYFLLSTLIILFSGLYSQEPFQKSMVVPIAYGDVSIDEVEREKFLVEIEVEYLTKPEQIDDSKQYYAVWAESRKDTSLLGVLNMNEEMQGHFTTQTTLEDEPGYILISAERTNQPESASDIVVLRSEELELKNNL